MWYVTVDYDPLNQNPICPDIPGVRGYKCKTAKSALRKMAMVCNQRGVSGVFARRTGVEELYTYNELKIAVATAIINGLEE